MATNGGLSFSQKLATVTSEATRLFQQCNIRSNATRFNRHTLCKDYHQWICLNRNALPPSIKGANFTQLTRAVQNATQILRSDPSLVSKLARSMPKESVRSMENHLIPLKTMQRRTFFSGGNSSRFANYRRLNKLEQEANASPTDARKQAIIYKEWLKSNNPQSVINRFERGNFTHNEECWQYYIAALAQTGKAESILPRIIQKIETSGVNEALLSKVKGGSNGKLYSNALANEIIKEVAAKNAVSASIRNGSALTAGELEAAIAGGSGNKANPIYVVVEEARRNLVWKVLKFVGGAVIWSFCILTVLSIFLESSNILKSTNSQFDYEPVTSSTVKFEDVQGVDEAKQELEEIVEFLKNPHRFTELGGKLPKGVLLTGPPGTGKTMLARAVAGEAGVPFFFMSGSEFDEMYVGVGARRVRELFAAARAKAPSIVFIDEIDAIGSRRNPRDQSYMKQTLNQLLVDLDGFSQTEGVIFIAATNFPELLDKALVRPGRFDRTVNVPLPDVRGRIAILKHHMKKIHIAKEVDVSVVARGTPGFSGADLANLVNQAAIQASRENSKEVTIRHLEYSKDKILMGAERKSAVITEENKRLTAYHEGGHALVAYYTPGALPLHKATIMPRGRALGMVVQLPEMDKDSYTKQEFLAMIDVSMGGRAAEELIFGSNNVTSGASSDISKATDVAKRMVRYYGMSDKVGPVTHDDDDMKLLSTQTKELIESEIFHLVQESEKRAKKILNEHREELDRLANALVEYETLDYQEIMDVLAGKAINRPK